MQSRQVLPGWFGVGYAIERFLDADEAHEPLLRQMMSQFPLFEDLIRNVETGMAKVDLAIARRYADLVTDEGVRERVFAMISEEFDRTLRVILRVTGRESAARDKYRSGAIDSAPQPVCGSDQPYSTRSIEAQARRRGAGRRRSGGAGLCPGRNH